MVLSCGTWQNSGISAAIIIIIFILFKIDHFVKSVLLTSQKHQRPLQHLGALLKFFYCFIFLVLTDSFAIFFYPLFCMLQLLYCPFACTESGDYYHIMHASNTAPLFAHV